MPCVWDLLPSICWDACFIHAAAAAAACFACYPPPSLPHLPLWHEQQRSVDWLVEIMVYMARQILLWRTVSKQEYSVLR